MTLYGGRTKEEFREFLRQRKAKDRESVRKHKPRVTAVESDGKYVDVELTQENGERVWATYKLIGWKRAPTAVAWEFHRMARNPPQTVTGRLRPPKARGQSPENNRRH